MAVALNPHSLSWYMQEISMHGLGANLAYQALLRTVEDVETRQTGLVWFHLTSFLHHAAMISKFIAPASRAGDVAKERGVALRHALCVPADSEILPRDARDNVEHFDERMDRWICDASPVIFEIVLESREDYEYLRVADKRVKRVLVADEFVFVSERKDSTKFELQLRPLQAEIDRVSRGAGQWLGQSSPYTFVHPRRDR